ncbi:hypothetical protein QOZ80_1BG0088310 [Eleusine coracana subsp. coracana]|nr:hypothetical protein QOZ80_1BG0088310 [Eleusine coracana subsp. coracana]
MATAMKRSRNSFLQLLSMAVAMLFQHAAFSSSTDFPVGSQATVQLPPAPYQPGFAALDVVLRAQEAKSQPGFVAAVSVEAVAGGYTCALVVLMGGVKVWASDHLDKFVPTVLCRLELTGDGQLLLTDGAGTIGWVSGTAGQGVKALHLHGTTGNLVLIDAKNHTRWQSFDHPTDKFLRGEQRRLPLYFIVPTTKVISSATFYSFELDGDKIAAYVNLGESKYSYWELAPDANNTIMASARLDGSGLKMLDTQGITVAQITPPVKKPPLSFLALEEDGNLAMYYYKARHHKFKASYRALGFCELPLSCGIGGEVCSAAGKCSDVSVYADDKPTRGGGNSGSDSSICSGTNGGGKCMVHLRSATTVLRPESPAAVTNVTQRQCVEQCVHDISCNAALYVTDDGDDDIATTEHGVCSHYTLVAGAREVIDGSRRFSYWVKFSGGDGGGGGSGRDEHDDDDVFHGSVRVIIIVCGAIDVGCALVFAVVIALYLRHRRQLVAAVGEPPAGEIEAVQVE